VLISAVNLTGFEFRPPPLNPYEQFKKSTPTTAIDNSVFVYDGHFEIPLAAALEFLVSIWRLFGVYYESAPVR